MLKCFSTKVLEIALSVIRPRLDLEKKSFLYLVMESMLLVIMMIIKTNVLEGYYSQFKVSSKAYEKPADIYNMSILKKILEKTYQINVYDIHVHLCI